MYISEREEKRAILIDGSVRKWNRDILPIPFLHKPTTEVIAFLSGLKRVYREEITEVWNNLKGGI